MLLNRSPSLLCVKYPELLFSKRIWMEGRFHTLVPHNRTFFFYHQVVLSAVIRAFFVYTGWRVVRWFGLRSFMIRARVCRMIQAFFFSYRLLCKGYSCSLFFTDWLQANSWLIVFLLSLGCSVCCDSGVFLLQCPGTKYPIQKDTPEKTF